jgi:hypothetical protein
MEPKTKDVDLRDKTCDGKSKLEAMDGASHGCVYDDLFSPATTKVASELCFDTVVEFLERRYHDKMLENDALRMRLICTRANSALKLAFVIMTITHEQALHDQVFEGCTDDGILAKVHEYRRLLSIVARSSFESLFTEANDPAIVGRFLQVCKLGWCMDRVSLANFCDFFGARIKVAKENKIAGLDDMPTKLRLSKTPFDYENLSYPSLATQTDLDEAARRIRTGGPYKDGVPGGNWIAKPKSLSPNPFGFV